MHLVRSTEAAEFDVVVIGAGIAGLSVAAVLAATHRVAVLETEAQPGYHATGRSAALFSTLYGAAPIRALSRAAEPFFRQPPTGFAEAPLLKSRGVLFIATAGQAAAFEAFAAAPDVAAGLTRLTPQAALSCCPILRPEHAACAALEAGSADVDVHGLHQGYLRMLRAAGGVLLTGRAAERLDWAGGRWIVRTGEGSVSAPVVVNAAGAWADEVGQRAGAGQIGLQPLRRTALLVDPPDGATIDAWPLVLDIDEAFYFKPDAGLLLLSPADETLSAPCDAQPEDWDVATAVDRVETATTLRVRRVRHRWAGLRSFVADRAPVVGWDMKQPGFFWLAGQGGYGIQTAPALARAAGALIRGEPIPADILDAGLDSRALSPDRLSATMAAVPAKP